jgi:prevent-host-death family protein
MTAAKWKSENARAHFDEMLSQAAQSPQTITRRGQAAVIVMSARHFARFAAEDKKPAADATPKMSLYQFLRNSPFVGLDLGFERDRSPPREIDL